MRLTRSAAFIAAALVLPVTAAAQTYQAQTGTLEVRIRIEGGCKVGDAVLDFGTHTDLTVNKDAATEFKVVCSKDLKYWVGLDQGSYWDAGTNIRRMETGGEYIWYKLYSDSARTIEWRDNINTDTIGPVAGTGAEEPHVVYGRVWTGDQPAPMPSPGTYADKVHIKVAY